LEVAFNIKDASVLVPSKPKDEQVEQAPIVLENKVRALLQVSMHVPDTYSA
jgi:hypothetical protein